MTAIRGGGNALALDRKPEHHIGAFTRYSCGSLMGRARKWPPPDEDGENAPEQSCYTWATISLYIVSLVHPQNKFASTYKNDFTRQNVRSFTKKSSTFFCTLFGDDNSIIIMN